MKSKEEKEEAEGEVASLPISKVLVVLDRRRTASRAHLFFPPGAFANDATNENQSLSTHVIAYLPLSLSLSISTYTLSSFNDDDLDLNEYAMEIKKKDEELACATPRHATKPIEEERCKKE
uniref:Uncharacterized protein n=1 Tax=Caenorhabditis japonica TaxID=281687 RepID=A0A8R1IP53_CAEJA